MLKQRLIGAVGAGLLALGGSTAQAAIYATCACEHLGSPYDGICEAWPQTGTETYTWYPWGSAWLPYPTDPYTGMAYYTATPGQAGGLVVTVARPSTGEQSTVACAFHTGGG